MPLTPKRVYYTEDKKEPIIAILHAKGGNEAAALRVVHQKSGCEKIHRKHHIRWLRDGTSGKPRTGRPVDTGFERAVLGHLLYTVLEKVDDVSTARIIANVTHSYDVAKLAARTTQWRALRADNPKIQKLKFSNPWVAGSLGRATLRHRRRSASDKELPPVVEAGRMKEI